MSSLFGNKIKNNNFNYSLAPPSQSKIDVTYPLPKTFKSYNKNTAHMKFHPNNVTIEERNTKHWHIRTLILCAHLLALGRRMFTCARRLKSRHAFTNRCVTTIQNNILINTFSFFLRREITCFTVVRTTSAYDHNFSILYSYLCLAGSNLIPGKLEHIFQRNDFEFQKRKVPFSVDVLADPVDVVFAQAP